MGIEKAKKRLQIICESCADGEHVMMWQLQQLYKALSEPDDATAEEPKADAAYVTINGVKVGVNIISMPAPAEKKTCKWKHYAGWEHYTTCRHMSARFTEFEFCPFKGCGLPIEVVEEKNQ